MVKNDTLGAVLLGVEMALEDYPGYDSIAKLRDGYGVERVVGQYLIDLGYTIMVQREDEEMPKSKKKGYEFILYHCYEHKEFRVKVESGKSRTLEPCPKCKAKCVRAMPHALDIEFSSKCGGRCVMCPRGGTDFSRKIGDMSGQTFKHLFKEIRTWNQKQPNTIRLAFCHMFGESVAHPHFVEWVNKLSTPVKEGGAGLGTLIVSTNGMALSEKLTKSILASGLHRLVVSLDGVSKKTLEAIRPGVKFEIVQENVDRLLKLARQRSGLGRRIPSICLQILKLDANEHEWLKMVQKYTKNNRIRTMSPKGRQHRGILGLSGGEVFCKSVERFGFMDELKKNKGWDGADHRRLTCDKVWKRASIWWDGKVPSPACCYTAQSDEIFGVIGKNSLHGIWLGDKFRAVREEFALYQKSKGAEGILPELCRKC